MFKPIFKLTPKTKHTLRVAREKCADIAQKLKNASFPKSIALLIVGALLNQMARLYFRPQLSVSFAYSEMVTHPIEGSKPKFISYMIDQFPIGHARIVAPNSIEFNSKNDFQWTSEEVDIGNILIANIGNASAKHVRAAVGLPKGGKMIVTPNVEVVNGKETESSGDHPTYQIIEIPRLNVGEAAVVTVTAACDCSTPDKLQVSTDDRLFLPILPMQKNNDNSFRLLFLTDEDASPTSDASLSMKEFLDLESGYFPTEGKGLWATGLTIKKGAIPVIEPLQDFKVEIGKKDKNGHSIILSTDHPVPTH